MSSGIRCQRLMSVWRVGPKTLESCCDKHRNIILEAQGLATFIGHDCECGHCPGYTILPGTQDGTWFKQLNRYILETELDAEKEEVTAKRARTDTELEAAEGSSSATASYTDTELGAAEGSSSATASCTMTLAVATPTAETYNPLSISDED